MAVFRVEKNHNYTVMSNYHLRDTALTLKAIGLLSKMLSLTDEWDYTTRGLAAICKEGVDAIGAALKELELHGYLVRRQLRDSRGRITDTEYTIYESPHPPLPDTASPDTENPYLDTPDTDEPYTEKPAQLNKDRRNKEKEIPDESITDTSNPDPIYPPVPLQGAGYDGMGYEEAREIVRENIEYDILVQDPRQDREQLDEVVELIAETLCSRKKTIPTPAGSRSRPSSGSTPPPKPEKAPGIRSKPPKPRQRRRGKPQRTQRKPVSSSPVTKRAFLSWAASRQ